MDETARVLARLARIEELRRLEEHPLEGGRSGRAPALPVALLLDELRALVPEAEAWARAEGDARARTAATKLREESEGTGRARARTAATKLREESEGTGATKLRAEAEGMD